MITMSWCRKCYTAYLGSEDITVAQFWFLWDSKFDARSHIKKMLNTKFAHKVVGVFSKLAKKKKKDDCLWVKCNIYA